MNVIGIIHVPGERFDQLIRVAEAALDVLKDENAGVRDRLVASSELVAAAEALTFQDMPKTFEFEESS